MAGSAADFVAQRACCLLVCVVETAGETLRVRQPGEHVFGRVWALGPFLLLLLYNAFHMSDCVCQVSARSVEVVER
jgi:hypothetical protein